MTQLTAQSGIALVITLILLLVITAMGLGIAYVATVQSDLVSSVVDKSLSIDASETCFDNAIEWLSSSSGRAWLNGAVHGEVKVLAHQKGDPLFGKTMLVDTLPSGAGADTRDLKFQNRIKRASYAECDVRMLDTQADLNIGNLNIGGEIGTSSGYAGRSFKYVLSITSIGNVMNGLATSSKSEVEVVLQFIP